MFVDDLCFSKIVPEVLPEFLLPCREHELVQRGWQFVHSLAKLSWRHDFADSIFRSFGFDSSQEREGVFELLCSRAEGWSVGDVLQPGASLAGSCVSRRPLLLPLLLTRLTSL